MPARPPAVALDDVAVSLASSSAAPAPDSPSEKSTSSMSRSGSASKRKGSVAQHGSNKEVHKAALEALEVMHKLPPGWHMTKDESSGRKYYYNPTTGATSWEAPPPPPEGQPSPAKPKAGGGANAALLVSVDAWLSDIGHEALQPIFAENGIELLADLRALDESDLDIFGFEDDVAAALWVELEKLPQADEMVIETSGYSDGFDMSEERSEGAGHVAPAQKRAALLADIAGGAGGLSAGLRHVSFTPKSNAVDSRSAMLAGIKGGQTKLKSVPKDQKGASRQMSVADPALESLCGMLASAMTNRRAAAGFDNDDEDSDGWDDD